MGLRQQDSRFLTTSSALKLRKTTLQSFKTKRKRNATILNQLQEILEPLQSTLKPFLSTIQLYKTLLESVETFLALREASWIEPGYAWCEIRTSWNQSGLPGIGSGFPGSSRVESSLEPLRPSWNWSRVDWNRWNRSLKLARHSWNESSIRLKQKLNLSWDMRLARSESRKS
jgi:hypothetical protein